MELMRLGRTNMMVSRLGFGGIPIQRLSEEDAVAVVKRCLDLGITFLDTANGYTTSEERIGKAIAGRRSKVILATKSGARNREDLGKHLKLSLKGLGVDYIDLYQFHGVNDLKSLDAILAPDGLMAVVAEAREAGLVRHIGITSHQIDVAKKAVQSDRFETIMFPFNFLTPEAADELFPLCRRHDVGFIDMKPMAGGMVDNASVAFKYLRSFPEVVMIPGIERIDEIEEIAAIFEGPVEMTGAELREMERIKNDLGTKFCHRCDYCQPCTAQIPISAVLACRSFYKRLPAEGFFGGFVGPAMAKATECADCGQCEERCPYNLPIREMIKEQAEWYAQEKRKYEERVGCP
jgi:predicted aldo/keto reductase-like oxidoreductase